MKKKKIHQGQVIGTGEKVFNIGMAILGILISLVVLYPIYYVLIASLSQPYYVENGDVMFAVKHFTLASYREAVKKSGIWLAYGNTIFYTVAGVAVNMLFTTTMAYALSKRKRPLSMEPTISSHFSRFICRFPSPRWLRWDCFTRLTGGTVTSGPCSC